MNIMKKNEILTTLKNLEKKISENQVLQKKILDLKEACDYTHTSASWMYKLTSANKISHYCPQGKKIYFLRKDLDEWMLKNRRKNTDEIEQEASDYIISKNLKIKNDESKRSN
jgi:excisionase family DNA binding protein